MQSSDLVIVAVVAYLLGSIPFGYILVRLFTGADVRAQGSGNICATNVARTGNKGLAIATLLLDAAKGWAAVWIATYILNAHWGEATASSGSSPTHDSVLLLVATAAALLAVLGHMFPVWLKFKGGKGVATGLGVFVALAPKALVVSIVVFAIVVAITRYVSLGSIVASAVFPFSFWYLHRGMIGPVGMAIVAAVSLLIIWKHKDNIKRLMAGTENKLGGKPKESAA